MTSGARPTWVPAKGSNEQGGTRTFNPSQKYSSRDIAYHTFLKLRKEGQDTQDELQKRNLRDELEERERRHFSSRDEFFIDDKDRSIEGHLLLGAKRDAEVYSRDAGDSDEEVKSEDASYDDDDKDEDEDDTKALLAELEQIKKERLEEKLRREQLKRDEELKAKEAELLQGNPLLYNSTSSAKFNIKRRWDDDVVFKNQACGETKAPKRFINDTIRNDFHRKVLQR